MDLVLVQLLVLSLVVLVVSLFSSAFVVLAVLAVPQVVDAILFVRGVATQSREDPTLSHF